MTLYDFMPTISADNTFQMIADFLTDNYIDNNSILPSHIWVVASLSSTYKTNTREYFHSKFNLEFYYSHPQIG